MISITAVIPVYNVEKYLERCLNSVLDQTSKFDEIILVDDGSTDSSATICDKYAGIHKEIKVIHKENAGLSSARNAGIRLTTSSYVTFIDSDDWLDPEFCASMLKVIDCYAPDMIMCSFLRASSYEEFFNKRNNSKNIKIYSKDDFLKIFLRYSGNRTVHYAWGKLFKRSILSNDQFPLGLLNEDVEGTFKAVLKANSIVETSECLYCYFINENGITGSGFGESYLNLPTVWKRILDIASSQKTEIQDMVLYNYKRSYFTVLADSLIHGTRYTDFQYNTEINSCLKNLRKNLINLLLGPMPFNRKLIAIGFSIAWNPLRSLYRYLKQS